MRDARPIRTHSVIASQAERGFYTKCLNADGIVILGASSVESIWMERAANIINEMLACRPDIRANLIANGQRLMLYGNSDSLRETPEGAGATFEFGGVFVGTGAVSNQFEGTIYHEWAHVIHYRGFAQGRLTSTPESNRISQLFLESRSAGLWEGTYASNNEYEWFAQLAEAYFGVAPDSPVNVGTTLTGQNGVVFVEGDNGVNGTTELSTYDRGAYDFLTSIYCPR